MTLQEFQTLISKHNVDAYLISHNNMFLGQNILAEENKLQELSGFSGSSGTLVVLSNKAYLLVDGRYELQAQFEVDTSKVEVVCTTDTLGTWMNNSLLAPLKIMYNPWCHSVNEVDYWQRALKKHTFMEDTRQLLGNRVAEKEANIFEHDIEFCGISTEEKISYLTKFINEQGLEAYFISECDSVSWLMNLRSDCLANTPILRAFALVDKQGDVSLFTNNVQKIEKELSAYKGKNIGLNYTKTPKKIQTLMKDNKIWVENLQNPIENWKAAKNEVERQGIQKAHLRDGVAITEFLHWLDNNWQNQDELSVVAKLHSLRLGQKNFYGNSFETIAACGANGAIVHYQPDAKTNQPLASGSVLLLDSGAQYYDGTTDITRTIALGEANTEIKDSYTQVLKAHIAVASAYFPAGVGGNALDALSRAELWKFGKEYHHGTGHGVGCFLNVHEGPFSLSGKNSQPLGLHMVTSIEPGFYKEGHYGIRIENLALITQAPFENMLKFEPLTLAPLDKRLINKYLLTAAEINWVDEYHALVWQKLHNMVTSETAAWLQKACSPL